MSEQPVTKIVLQQHSRLLRDMLVRWLATLPGYAVVGVTESKADLRRLCRRSRPDVIVLEIGSECQARFPEYDQIPYLIGLYGRPDVVAMPGPHPGVQRLVSTQSGLGGLYAALQAARTAHRPADPLTARELEVLALIRIGWSTSRIAATLAISPHTVINHTRRIFTKLNVRSRTQAAAEATARGLFEETGSRPVVLVDPTPNDWSTCRGEVIVALSAPNNGTELAEAVARGAGAVLDAQTLTDDLPSAVTMMHAGYLVAPAKPVRALIAAAHPPELTRRERDILNSIANGDSVRQTAQALGIAIKTVQNEQRQLFCRLGARNRIEALLLARDLGLVPAEESFGAARENFRHAENVIDNG